MSGTFAAHCKAAYTGSGGKLPFPQLPDWMLQPCGWRGAAPFDSVSTTFTKGCHAHSGLIGFCNDNLLRLEHCRPMGSQHLVQYWRFWAEHSMRMAVRLTAEPAQRCCFPER